MSNIAHLIKHKPHITVKERAIVSIIYSSNLIEKHWERILAEFNLTTAQFNLLRLLHGEHPIPLTASELKEKIIDKKSDVSRMVERLRRAGYLKTEKHGKDKRSVQISITEKGVEILSRVVERQHELNIPTSTISDEEANQITLLLDKFLNAFKN